MCVNPSIAFSSDDSNFSPLFSINSLVVSLTFFFNSLKAGTPPKINSLKIMPN
jgi:hypothetical protein